MQATMKLMIHHGFNKLKSPDQKFKVCHCLSLVTKTHIDKDLRRETRKGPRGSMEKMGGGVQVSMD